MAKKFDLAVYIGRFQPFHLGHLHVLEQCKKIATSTLVLVGSSFRPSTLKNPFGFRSREVVIEGAAKSLNMHVGVYPLRDYLYNDVKWAQDVQDVVDWYCDHLEIRNPKVAIVGHVKDDSSYYLKEFPQWELVQVEGFEDISATPLRESLYSTSMSVEQWLNSRTAKRTLPDSTRMFLATEHAQSVVSERKVEYDYIQAYKKSWEAAPYAPTFVTVDAVVIQQSHILLVKRGGFPGKGLWALPGGFLNKEETLVEGAIRELREETRLKVPPKVLKGSIVNQHTFDAPGRSERGRTLTTAFHIHLGPLESGLPEVRGSDDADEAEWVPLNKVDSQHMFEDHFDIITYFVPLKS